MAGHAGEQVVAAVDQFAVGAELGHLCQHVTNQLFDIALCQQGRHGPHRDRRKASAIQGQPHGGKLRLALLGQFGLRLRGVEGQRGEQLLAGEALGVDGLLELLVGDAFVGGVHIDDHQTFGVLRQYVDAVQLGNGVA